MAHTVGDFVAQRIAAWGIQRIYAYPGDGINGVIAGIRRNGDRPRFIQVRHEEMSAFMACAHAKYTGEVGVCLATSGPGAIHLLNGLYDAKMDHQPVVAIIGQSATTALGSSYQQEVDLQTLFKDVASEYCQQVNSPTAARHCIDRAFRIAKDQRCPTVVIFPKDIQEQDAVPNPKQAHDMTLTGIGHAVPFMIPQRDDLRRAADLLNAGDRVAILIGQGALGATDEVIEIANLLGAGVAKAWLGKAALPDDIPFCTGGIGLLGTRPTYEMMQDCDTLLVIGSSFPYVEYYPKPGQAKGIQIDIDGRMLSLRYPMEVNCKGDAKETLQALVPLIDRKRDRSWQQKIEEHTRDWWHLMEKRSMDSANPINPQRVFWELNKKLPDNCILSADSGTAAVWFGNTLQMRRGMMASGSGNLASMGPAVPYAVAAKFCFPDRVAIALTGDGAMQMNGLNTLITVAKYWEEWTDPRFITLVLNNRDLNMVTWEQRIMEGDIKFEASQNLPDFNYAHYAESLGFKGIRVDDPDHLAAAWDEALDADRPVVVDALTDGNVPILPPHITLEQAKNFATALLKGDPNESGILKQAVKGMMDSIMPGQ
ncbi:MAG: thiamine pyrophosphate-requiring protein [Phycisphaerales bacterium]|nr:thiamine pyrophosphate-requiring protein [Phycisphaerales bacterium]